MPTTTSDSRGIPARPAAIERLHAAAPHGLSHLTAETIDALWRATDDIVIKSGLRAEQEYSRFVKTVDRGIRIDEGALRRHFLNKNILVTGGTGCIGTKLLTQLALHGAGRLTSISRGLTRPDPSVAGVEYLITDIRSAEATQRTLRTLKPDIIFHLAAEHNPGLAEQAVKRTLETNIYGTHHIIEAAKTTGVGQIVYASTGKAMRFLTPEIYAASKKASEVLMARAAQSEDVLASGSRFTHVVDNSIIHARLRNWIASRQPIRLHDTDILFYVQSALESAQLLMDACLAAEVGTLKLEAIRDLEWPISLLDLAVGAIVKTRARTPLYVCGYEAGYEEIPYPALFDRTFSGDAGPLVNGFEAAQVHQSPTCPQVEVFPFTIDITPEVESGLHTLWDRCAGSNGSEEMRRGLTSLSWAMLDARLAKVSLESLRRSVKTMEADPNYATLPAIHRRTNEAVRLAIERRTSAETC